MGQSKISASAIIYPDVQLGEGCIIEDYVIIGAPPKPGMDVGPTIIGDGAHIRSHSVIYAGNTIGHRFVTGNKANIRELNQIGDDVSIGTLSIIEHHVVIEDGVRIHSQVFIPEYSRLENGCWIGPNVVFTNAKYPNTPSAKDNLVGPTICAGAVVGANSTLLPGVRIGTGAVVGAGSVVTRDCPDGTVNYGHPSSQKD